MLALDIKILYIYYKFGERLSDRSVSVMTDSLTTSLRIVEPIDHDDSIGFEEMKKAKKLHAHHCEMADLQLKSILESTMALKTVKARSMREDGEESIMNNSQLFEGSGSGLNSSVQSDSPSRLYISNGSMQRVLLE